MHGKLTQADGGTVDATPENVRQSLAGPDFFWLDLDELDAFAVELLLHGFGFHPLAVEDAEKFGQRPKMEDYDGFTHLVVHGAQAFQTADTVEVHVFYSAAHVVTVHRGGGALFDDVRECLGRHRQAVGSTPAASVLYLVVDRLVDSYFPVLSQFDDRIDDLEDAILKRPTEAQLGELFAMKQALVGLRKVVTPQRDMFASLVSGVHNLEGIRAEDERYFRDLYDHLIRVSDLVDSYRDLLTGAMDTHISIVSNRLNVVMKQLTIIATIFLPLSYLTGFFGQNFSFLVGHITGRGPFFLFGLGLELIAVIILLYFFRRRGWLGGPTT